MTICCNTLADDICCAVKTINDVLMDQVPLYFLILYLKIKSDIERFGNKELKKKYQSKFSNVINGNGNGNTYEEIKSKI